MSNSGLSTVVESRRLNAALAASILLFLAVAAVAQLVDGDHEWAGFTIAVLAVALVPPLARRSPTAMLPWEVVLLAALPIVSRALVAGETVGGMTFSGRIVTYVAVAAVALLIAVELDVFTGVKMSHRFAVVFVVVTTMAAAGIWAVVRWLSDVLLGTRFLYDGRPEAVIEEALMWDFVAATFAGIFAGVLFEYYFRRHARLVRRIPESDPGARPDEDAGKRPPGEVGVSTEEADDR
ncbi:hypothetical protein [Halobellus sp. H-GB7]|uniref:hypothetical protein n=1 Tax=Halobellus sp. H-GB7 TaxID=3069756 RepID=UPI0027B311C0|nr:hypothetical protein [Halobellus sp. H-GB7]MDQ2055065.1 hypothetical protein [Halobellus sp. H-GB7]